MIPSSFILAYLFISNLIQSPNAEVTLLRKKKPPRADEVMNYIYNVFRGKTPEQQRQGSQGEKLFRYNGLQDCSDTTYRKYKQFSDISSVPTCHKSSGTAGRSYLTGSGVLDWGLMSTFHANGHFGKESFFDNFLKIFSGKITKLKNLEKIVLSGNAEGSMNALAKFEAGYEFGYSKYISQSLYSAKNDFDSISTWTAEFRRAITALGTSPTDLNVLEFFSSWGTHVIEQGLFGRKCENTLYSKGGTDFEAYQTLETNAEINSALDNFESANGIFDVVVDNVGSMNGEIKFEVSQEKKCMGSTPKKSQCDFVFPTFKDPQPVLLDFTYKAIWDVNIPHLPVSVAERMEDVAAQLIQASVDCGKNYCNNKGYCVANDSAWDAIQKEDINDFSIFWDSNRCICFEDDVQSYPDCSTKHTPAPTPAPTTKPQYRCEQKYLGIFQGNCVALPVHLWSPKCEDLDVNTPHYIHEFLNLPKVYDNIDWVDENMFIAVEAGWNTCGGGGQYNCNSYAIECHQIED